MSCGEREKSSNFDSLFDGSDAHLLPSSPEDCAAKLQQYNRWRRGKDSWPDEDGPNLKELMLLIDYAADALEPKVCCGEFETCRAMCVPRASHFKWQRDELLAEFNAYKEGSEEAFGTVVAQKQAAEARLQTMQSTIASQQGVICDFREQRDELLEALQSISKITGEAGFNIGGPLEHCPGELEHDEAKRLLSLACEYLKDTSKAACRAIASAKGSAA